MPITPEFPLEVAYENRTIRSEFENGVVQTRAAWPLPRRRWTLQWTVASSDEAEVLQAFVREHQGAARPFLWAVSGLTVPRPYAGPELSQTAGGALGARTRYAAFSWADASRETTPSYVVAALAVGSGYLLTATAPRFPAGVTQAWVYVGETAAALCRQATAITTTAGTWTEPVGGYDSGGVAPQTVNALTETVKVCFTEDLHVFTRITAKHWTCKASVIEVL